MASARRDLAISPSKDVPTRKKGPMMFHGQEVLHRGHHTAMMLRRSSHKQVVRLRRHLSEHFGERGAEREKLRALILCVRRRKSIGYEQAAIAERAKLSPRKVREILAGEFDAVNWEQIEAVLEALGAHGRRPEITVARELYAQVALTQSASGVRRPGSPSPTGPTTQNSLSQANPPVPPTRISESDKSTRATPHSDPGDGPPSLPPHLEPDQPGKELDDQAEEVAEIDPLHVQTVEAFTTAMEVFRAMRGQRTLRDMVEHSTDLNDELKKRGLEVRSYVASSYSNLIRDGRTGKLSSKELVLSYIAGAGGSAEELEHWAKAWMRIKAMAIQSKNTEHPTPDP